MKDRPVFVGRAAELAHLNALCDNTEAGGSAVVIEGDPGVGKTALVQRCALDARSRGMRVLRVSAAPSETGIPYAALHMLLHPVRALFTGLPEPQREALDIAFGLRAADGPAAPLLVGLATLTVLSDAAATQPLLVIADDVHWFDSASRGALEMAARRLTDDRIVVLMTTRGPLPADHTPGIEQLHLGPLGDADASALIGTRTDITTGRAARAVLDHAAGNPLALLELQAPELVGGAFDLAPVTGRLEATFAGRYREMPEPIRLAVLAMALGDSPSPERSSLIVADITGRHLDPAWVDTVITAGLVLWSPEGLRFRHPLVRAAVTSASRPSERSAVLQALVNSRSEEASHTLWWRAELAVDLDDALGMELTELARSATYSGDHRLAARAYERSADMTTDTVLRAIRRLDAAEAASAAGANDSVSRLIAGALSDTDQPAVHARARWLREILAADNSSLGRGDFGPALDAIAALHAVGAVDDATGALVRLASVMWDHSSDTADIAPIVDAIRRQRLLHNDPRQLFLEAVSEPVVRGEHVITTVDAIDPDTIADPYSLWLLGFALNMSGEHENSRHYTYRAVDALRGAGDTALLPHALMGASWISYHCGQFTKGRELAEECLTLATDLGNPALATGARVGLAWYDGMDGIPPDLDAITAGSSIGATVLDARAIRATVLGARASAALVSGRPRLARDILTPCMDPTDPSYSVMFALVLLPDLVDASIQSGRREHAAAWVAGARTLRQSTNVPLVDAVVRFSDIALSDDEAIDDTIDHLADRPLPMPYLHARAELIIGTRLRRLRRIEQSRTHLRRALVMFENLPAPAWAERCREALRASGERLPDQPPSGIHVLTPQERRIATLAAGGARNRAIAEQLYLSPRTIAAHLHSAFRKLGVTSRDQLQETLDRSRRTNSPS